MSKPCLCDPAQASPVEMKDLTPKKHITPAVDLRRPVNEMARVLKTTPVHIASDLSGGAISQWSHDAFHEVVEPMTDHVIMTYVGTRATAGTTQRQFG